jgi:type IV secretory pathway VirB2 component (pilin)
MNGACNTSFMTPTTSSNGIKTLARLGLIAKGVVYLLIGTLAFMAAFELGGASNANANKSGVFHLVLGLPLGKALLLAIAAGLLCYAVWRAVQAFRRDGGEETGWSKRLRYALSSLVYISVALGAARVAMHKEEGGGGKGDAIQKLFGSTNGPTIIIIAAIVIAAIGLYQLWYAYSEKYKEHVSLRGVGSKSSSLLLTAGKLGYTARGLVWLIIAWLLVRATNEYSASKAGDTAQAFQFLEEASYGSYLLGGLGIGLACYGVFNFIRARYETFD